MDNTLSSTKKPNTYCCDGKVFSAGIPIYCLPPDVPMNTMQAKNIVANAADGEYILFLDKHVVIKNADWLEKMLVQGQCADTGAVSGELYYPDDTICYGLMLLRKGGWPVYHGKRQPADKNGDQHKFIRETTAVSGAMLLIRKEFFLQAGAFDEAYINSELAAIDLCLRLRAQGKHNIFNPHAKGYIYLGSNDERITMQDKKRFTQKNGSFERDIFYNPNFSLKDNQTIWYLGQ